MSPILEENLYRKKPLVIKAYDFSITKKDSDGQNLYDDVDPSGYYIDTLEGKLRISEDDFVIRGIKGEKYPCKRDIFFKTYDKVIIGERG